jgi:toxin ParE1/3/4
VAVILKRPRALIDLAEIWAYFAEDSIVNADAFAALIDKKLRLLAKQPGMGRARPELGHGLRSFVVGRYVVFYQPSSKGIEIVRVLHGARDIDATLEVE